MNTAQIVMLVIGILALVASFVVPQMREKDNLENRKEEQEEIKKLVEAQLESVHSKVEQVVDESIQYAMEKTERSLERLSNEKIMAVSEYSETVLSEINNSHKEVVFLHDMLNGKQDELKESMGAIQKDVEAIKQEVTDYLITVKEASDQLEEAKTKAQEMMDEVRVSMQQAKEVAENMETEAAKHAKEREDALVREIEEIAKHKEELVAESQSATEAREQADEAIRKVKEEVLKLSEEKAQALRAMEEAKKIKDSASQIEYSTARSIDSLRGNGTTETSRTQAYDAQFRRLSLENVTGTKKEEIPRAEERQAKERTKENVMDLSFMPSDDKKNSNERILSLHKAGKSNMAIAKELGLGIGEVKLVIDLFQN